MAITHSGTGTAANGTSATTYPVSVSISAVAGESIVLLIVTGAASIFSIWDNAGNTYSLLESETGTSRYCYLYGTANISNPVNSVTVSFTATVNYALAIITYTGVTGFSATNVKATNSTSETITSTLPSGLATGSWSVAGVALYNASGTSMSATTGSLRNYVDATSTPKLGAAILDNTTVTNVLSSGTGSGNDLSAAGVEMTTGSSIAYTAHGSTAQGTSITALYTLRQTCSMTSAVAIIATLEDASTNTSIVDSQGNTYTSLGTEGTVQLWGCLNPTLPIKWAQQQRSSTFAGMFCIDGYAGVLAFNTGNIKKGSGSNSLSLTLPDALAGSSWTVGGMGWASTTNSSPTATTGTLRESVATGSVTAGYTGCDIDSTTTTVAANDSQAVTVYGIALEMTALQGVRARTIIYW